jgi:hypothetical protein
LITEQYFNINQTYEDFLNELFTFIDTNEIEKLVIDFRDNNGGVPGPNIAEEIKKRDKINQKGKLFVIVNRGTFSAPIKHSVYLKEFTNALIFGEPTGEMPYKGGPAPLTSILSSTCSPIICPATAIPHINNMPTRIPATKRFTIIILSFTWYDYSIPIITSPILSRNKKIGAPHLSDAP